MTDEFYACPDCGAFNEKFIIKHNINITVTDEELHKLEKDYPLIFGGIETEEYLECSMCEHKVEPIMVESTERY